MRLWIINAVFWLLMGCAGAMGGWWARGRAERASANQQKRLVREAMEGLQDCTAQVRARVASHASELKKVTEELSKTDVSGTEVAALAVEHIVDSTDQVRRQLSCVEQKLQLEATIIGRSITQQQPELLFMKRLDRKERLYRKVLQSLETLSNELAVDVEGHQSRLESIGNELEEEAAPNIENINSAVNQIISAASNMQNKIGRIEERLDVQTQLVEKHAKLAGKDELTGLPNRRTFNKELCRLHEEYRRHKKPFSLLMIDIDDFKKVNDRYGHQMGDTVLIQLGKLLAAQVRENDTAARYGGEEFAVLLPFSADFDAKLAAERLRKGCLAKPLRVEGKEHRLTISVGVSTVMPDSTPESTVQRADQALYAAKNAGRNCTFWHDGTDCIAFGSTKEEASGQLLAKFRQGDVESQATSSPTVSSQEQEEPTVVIPPEFELSNRSIFCVSVNRRLAECKRGGAAISLLLLRIDQSEQIGKEHGQRAVMELRAAVCRMLAALSRDMDDRCEFDAQTFAILLPDTAKESVRKIGERLRAGVSGCQMQFGDKKWDLTASVGVVHTAGDDSGMEFMNRGEKAVQAASDFGGNVTFQADRTGVTRITNLESRLSSH